MANHPQNSPRGLFAKNKILVGGAGLALTGDSTAITLSGGARLSGNSTGLLTHNTTGTLVANGAIEAGGALSVSGEALTLTADSTSLIASGSLRLSGNSTGIVSHDSTGRLTANGGVKISDAHVLTANSTSVQGPLTGLPGSFSTGHVGWGSNSTGGFIVVRGTGTGWKFLNVTADQPT